MSSVPRSEQFDDVYFSADDGLAETRHVFLDGNDLPDAWEDRERFVMAETGFGTGLNFLATWALFEETAAPGQCLDFISFELYPLTAEQIEEYLQPWVEHFKTKLSVLIKCYPLCLPGFHKVDLNEAVTLTLVFGDVNEELPKLQASVDAWFLDGFKPATNPEMWTDKVFREMARLSKPGTSFATFTAAGNVRRGLQAAGFSVEKVPGFGAKREMLAGHFY